MRKRSLSPLRLLRTGLFVVGVGLIGAVLLHIVIILALPRFTGGDAYSRVLGLYEMDSFFPLSAEPGPTGLANDDPYLRVGLRLFRRQRPRPLHSGWHCPLLVAGAL